MLIPISTSFLQHFQILSPSITHLYSGHPHPVQSTGLRPHHIPIFSQQFSSNIRNLVIHLQVAPLHTHLLLGLQLPKHIVRKLEYTLSCSNSSAMLQKRRNTLHVKHAYLT